MTVHELRIEGMSCGHCVRAVEQALASVPGVRKAEVGIGSAKIDADDAVTRDQLVRAVEEEEYRVVG